MNKKIFSIIFIIYDGLSEHVRKSSWEIGGRENEVGDVQVCKRKYPVEMRFNGSGAEFWY
jgi:hypothetical protein